eukprot:scaffold597_cov176-Amphora_coffeaeformis.AAC.18
MYTCSSVFAYCFTRWTKKESPAAIAIVGYTSHIRTIASRRFVTRILETRRGGWRTRILGEVKGHE